MDQTPELPPLMAELYAAAAARQATPTSQRVGWPLTPKEMERWDEKSRAAWSGLQS
ncbi:hypothetical protein [Polaromonas sp.]|uniref:hypothetical protein n=1 Tax=Polaromonas sp. TaxID=1869339 RepID=UPI0037512DA4